MKIEQNTLYKLLTGYGRNIDGWKIVNKKITSSDPEDGGGNYDVILKHFDSNKFYLFSYCDWDISNTDYVIELHERYK